HRGVPRGEMGNPRRHPADRREELACGRAHAGGEPASGRLSAGEHLPYLEARCRWEPTSGRLPHGAHGGERMSPWGASRTASVEERGSPRGPTARVVLLLILVA